MHAKIRGALVPHGILPACCVAESEIVRHDKLYLPAGSVDLRLLDCNDHNTFHLADSIALLDSSKLGDTSLAILAKTSTRGGTETARQRLTREKALHQAGIQLPDESRLLIHSNPSQKSLEEKQVAAPIVDTSIDTSSSDDTGSSSGRLGTKKAGSRPKAFQRDLSQREPPKLFKVNTKAHDSDSASDSPQTQEQRMSTENMTVGQSVQQVDLQKMRDVEELRRKMIASGEILGVLLWERPEAGATLTIHTN